MENVRIAPAFVMPAAANPRSMSAVALDVTALPHPKFAISDSATGVPAGIGACRLACFFPRFDVRFEPAGTPADIGRRRRRDPRARVTYEYFPTLPHRPGY